MQINYDRNHCCTAVCITSLSMQLYTDIQGSRADNWYRTAFPDGELPTRIKKMGDWNSFMNYRLFSEGLALLCNNFQKYTADLYKKNPNNYQHWRGAYRIGDLSTVFCFTSTGDDQEEIEEFLKKFGFEASSKRGSKKYRGESIVTLWSMDAAEFQKKCDEIIQEMRNEHEAHQKAICPSVEAAAVSKSKEKTSPKSSRKTRSVSAAA